MKPSYAVLLTGAAVLALFAGACGGGGGGSTPAQTDTKTETKAAGSPAAPAKADTQAETKPAGSPAAAPAGGKASGEPVKVGILCDRSGAVANNTIPLCDGMKD